MPTLSFKKQFCGRVEAGEKTHSLRSKRLRAWKVGDYLGLYYALRTKQARLLGKTTVVQVQDALVRLVVDPDTDKFTLTISFDGECLTRDEAESFARRDGFADLHEMMEFWAQVNGLTPGNVWRGDLIHWKFPFAEVLHVAGA